MLTFELTQTTNIQLTICYVRKSQIFQSHKSYKSPLYNIESSLHFNDNLGSNVICHINAAKKPLSKFCFIDKFEEI